MHFEHPERLYLLFLVPVVAGFLWVSAVEAQRRLQRFGNPELLARAGTAVARGRRALKSLLLLLGLALVLVALAGPQWGATREKIERKGVDVVVALDTSASMLAEDVAPSRLVKAKQAVINLIDLMKGDRIGLVVFAGAAFTMCPLTLDYNAARMFLDIINTQTVPEPGTNIAAALKEAGESFDKKSNKHKVIILISDGEHLETKEGEDPIKVAEELNKEGVIIFTVGVGETRGSSIPVETPEGKVDKTDQKGNIVITKLDENTLRKIALAGDGKYRGLNNQSKGDELAAIYAGVAGLEKKTFAEEYQVHFEDRFQWFLAGALFCFILEALIPDRKARKKP